MEKETGPRLKVVSFCHMHWRTNLHAVLVSTKTLSVNTNQFELCIIKTFSARGYDLIQGRWREGGETLIHLLWPLRDEEWGLGLPRFFDVLEKRWRKELQGNVIFTAL